MALLGSLFAAQQCYVLVLSHKCDHLDEIRLVFEDFLSEYRLIFFPAQVSMFVCILEFGRRRERFHVHVIHRSAIMLLEQLEMAVVDIRVPHDTYPQAIRI